MTCFCRRCVPTEVDVVCSACGQEVRYGIRNGLTGYLHREDVDHHAVLGHRAPMVNSRLVEEFEPELDEDGEPIVVEPLPPVEQPAHDIDPDSFAPRSGIRQVINLVGKTDGWEIVRLTAARGPYMGAKGQCLSISDTVLLKARQVLDDRTRIAVASWRDGKFDFAYVGQIQGGRLNPSKVDATTMKNWIKGTYDLPAPVQ